MATTSRFHIVKIDTGPQKRGRWTCLDSEVEQTHELSAAIVGGPAAEQPAVNFEGALAIDNKIEQAMDLVKTHLRYAVRGEVEVMKQRIQDLEKYVESLEKENKLLREYVPPEILAQITTATTTPASTAASTAAPASAAASAAQNLTNGLSTPPQVPVQQQQQTTEAQPQPSTDAQPQPQPTSAATTQPQAPPT